MVKDLFQIETTTNGIELNRENFESLPICFIEGLCAASLDNPDRPRIRDEFISQFLEPAIERGEIGDGKSSKWDDRKIRIDSLSAITKSLGSEVMEARRLDVALGITYFAEYKLYQDRSDQENLNLQERGLNEFGERYAFFGRAPGISGMIITQDGSAFLGVRDSDEFSGALQPVAGHWDYQERVADINLMTNLEKEIKEEFGVGKIDIKDIIPAGVFTDPVGGGIDFTYLVQTNATDTYFLSGEWIKSAKDANENSRLIQVQSYQSAQQLLETGTLPGSDNKYSLMQAARGALMSIRPEELAK